MTAVVENKTFEEKMKDRIRESIGDLISDEDLKKLVDKGIEDAFFKPKKISVGSGYNQHYEDGPSFLEATVKELLEPIFKKCVEEYIDSHREDVAKVVKETLEVGAGTLFLKALNQVGNNHLITLQNNIITDLFNRGVLR